MQSMPFADPSHASRSVLPAAPRSRGRIFGLVAALAAVVLPGVALAETGTALPQGYTPDVAAAPQVQVPQVQQANDPANDPAEEYADTDPSALTDFREPLAPYGNWVNDPTYGTIWVPDSTQVGPDFAPYQTSGRWATTDAGEWMWQSDYAWGAIPFHYGRWVWAGNYWGWIPGRTYAPAWVTWRVGDGGYLGWAPLPPSWYWGPGYAIGLGYVPYAAYCFVPSGYAFHGNLSAYVVRDRGLVQHAAASTHPYTPARPSMGGSHLGASPNHSAYRPASPSFAEAHVSASAAAHARSAPDARATAFSTRSSTAAARHAYAPNGGRSFQSARPQNAWHGNYSRSASPVRTGSPAGSPSLRTPTHAASPSFHSSAPSSHPSPSHYRSAPSYHGTPSSHAAPTHAGSTYRPPAVSRPTHVSGSHSGGRRR
jgi:hypothetical protein